jgi:hypothetical protein
MIGSLADRIYLTNKYPLSMDYRYRLIKDMQKSEAKKIVILNGGYYDHLFQSSDKSLFVDVQALPRLTPDEWAEFKQVTQSTATGVRVTKEEVSFVTMTDTSNYVRLQQISTDKVLDIASKMQIMWVGSNHRYEFPFGNCIYKLKVRGDCETIGRSFNFYFNSAKAMIPNWKKGDDIQFGIVVLPEGHQLRSLLPELITGLRSAALFEVREFFKVSHFQVDQNYEDIFIGYLKKNPLVFDKLLEGYREKASFDKWRASGMPKGERCIKKPHIPFFLWDDSDIEMKDAKALYEDEQNCVKVNIRNFYDYVSKKHPLFKYHYSYGGINNDVAGELIEYMKFKLGIKPNEDIERN